MRDRTARAWTHRCCGTGGVRSSVGAHGDCRMKKPLRFSPRYRHGSNCNRIRRARRRLRRRNGSVMTRAEITRDGSSSKAFSATRTSLSSNKIGSAQDQDRRSEDVRDVDETNDDEEVGCSPNALRVFPFKVSREALERVMSSMGLSERVCLIDLLEGASELQ